MENATKVLESKRRFIVAFSFPGDLKCREFVRSVAEDLQKRIPRESIFFDEWYEAELARPNLDVYLQKLYSDDSLLVVPFFCTDYERKPWCYRVEWPAIRSAFSLGGRSDDYLMPMKFDETELSFLQQNVGYCNIRGKTPEAVARLIFERLRKMSKIIDSPATDSISRYARSLLNDLSFAAIQLPIHNPINIIDTLKSLPRSGKLVRLARYPLTIPIRSVYDHVISVAHSADCLFDEVSHGIAESEIMDLARCIVYHDLDEVLLGDIPEFTNVTDELQDDARICSVKQLRGNGRESKKADAAKKVATEFISLHLDLKERQSLGSVTKILSNHKSPVKRYFHLLDKLDPIIAVWRYLHVYRGKLEPDAKDFVEKTLSDFFTNPAVKEVASLYTEDVKLKKFAAAFQNMRKAQQYYLNRESIGDQFGIPANCISNLIEGIPLTYIPEVKRKKFKKVSVIRHKD